MHGSPPSAPCPWRESHPSGLSRFQRRSARILLVGIHRRCPLRMRRLSRGHSQSVLARRINEVWVPRHDGSLGWSFREGPGVTLVLAKLGSGAGRRSHRKCRLWPRLTSLPAWGQYMARLAGYALWGTARPVAGRCEPRAARRDAGDSGIPSGSESARAIEPVDDVPAVKRRVPCHSLATA